MSELSGSDWRRVDSLLAQSQVLGAVMLYRELAGCPLAEAKNAVGDRFRVAFPALFRDYKNVGDED